MYERLSNAGFLYLVTNRSYYRHRYPYCRWQAWRFWCYRVRDVRNDPNVCSSQITNGSAQIEVSKTRMFLPIRSRDGMAQSLRRNGKTSRSITWQSPLTIFQIGTLAGAYSPATLTEMLQVHDHGSTVGLRHLSDFDHDRSAHSGYGLYLCSNCQFAPVGRH